MLGVAFSGSFHPAFLLAFALSAPVAPAAVDPGALAAPIPGQSLAREAALDEPLFDRLTAPRLSAASSDSSARFRRDESGRVVPVLHAAAAIIYNPETREVLWAENEDATRSIASITKVMTAIVLLDHEPDLSREVVVDAADLRRASTTFLRRNERLTLDTLLHLTLIASDNGAARVLARTSIFGTEGFVEQMNRKALELGLGNTRFADPSGLDERNVSTAYDIARLIAFASADERIGSLMRQERHRIETNRRAFVVRNTNRLLGSDLDIRAGKTGFIREAGYCLATLVRLPEGAKVAVVVLGAPSNRGRFSEARNLFDWITRQVSDFVVTDNEP